MRELNVALIGQGFMGRAHSHAWRNVATFFDVPIRPVLKVVCGTRREALEAFARRWGWEEVETDWRRAVTREDIHIVDITTPPWLHREIAVEAARHGKHIFCEKPLAMNAAEAQEMYLAAEAAKVVHALNHNYRKYPAVALAKRLIDQGRIGEVRHWRSAYFNSRWIDPQSPITWHLQREKAGTGVIGGLHSHTVDLARYLVGEIRSVLAVTKTFIPERPTPDGAGRAPVTVEDACFFLAEFANGAMGSFEASTLAPGRRNYNQFEVYGSEGSLAFNQERANELQFFSLADGEEVRGFRTILVTERVHPYMAAWWPPGHPIGYEHSHYHAIYEFLLAIHEGRPASPNFYDGWRGMQVLDAILLSAEKGQKVLVGEAQGLDTPLTLGGHP
jgi:predicted dehydrogenase